MNGNEYNSNSNGSQNQNRHFDEEMSWIDKVEAQVAAEEDFLRPKSNNAIFHPNPNWIRHKEERREAGKRAIQTIWQDHSNFLREVNFRDPRQPHELLPQYFADEDKNLRLAQILCLPIVPLRSQTYSERLRAWAINVISVLGNTVSELNYREWPNNEVFNYQEMNQKDGILKKIRARAWFTDLHHLAKNMRNGQNFITDLLHTIWDLQDLNTEGIPEEDFNKSLLTECYFFSANDCIKPDVCAKHVAVYCKPKKETISRLSDQFRLKTASKGNRDSIPDRMSISYAFNSRFTIVPPRRPKGGKIGNLPDKEKEDVTDNHEVTDQKERNSTHMNHEEDTIRTPNREGLLNNSPKDSTFSRSDF